jgi:hypothetical protein
VSAETQTMGSETSLCNEDSDSHLLGMNAVLACQLDSHHFPPLTIIFFPTHRDLLVRLVHLVPSFQAHTPKLFDCPFFNFSPPSDIFLKLDSILLDFTLSFLRYSCLHNFIMSSDARRKRLVMSSSTNLIPVSAKIHS